MESIFELKEREILGTPLVLFTCTFPDGTQEHWSTHSVIVGGRQYSARVLAHSLFDITAGGDDGVDALSRIGITLANADSYVSQLERTRGFRGCKLDGAFLFYDYTTSAALCEAITVFRGVINPVEVLTEEFARLSAHSRLNMQRFMLPAIRIQKRCPWAFPETVEQRMEALDGGALGEYSPFFRCGYSADLPGGAGNLSDGASFSDCDYTRSACIERGMFDTDVSGKVNRRFGGIEFLPTSILVRGHGDRVFSQARVVENEARYNDFIPLVYGTGWIQPPVVFARNDGNLTRAEVVLCLGEIEGVVRVVVNGVEIPEGVAGSSMSATGWYNLVNKGNRTGGFNLDFCDSSGNPLGDPYGNIAYLAVVVPNRISDGRKVPEVEVLLKGRKLPVYSEAGQFAGKMFSANPAWVLLDLLRLSGWSPNELDFLSFAQCAAFCDDPIILRDLNGNAQSRPRFQCNLVLGRRRAVADLIRGVRLASQLSLVHGANGKIQARVLGRIAEQHPSKEPWSNAKFPLAGGWPAYEFGDGTYGTSGIVRRSDGSAAIRLFSRTTGETPNRLTVEFQDEFNEYQQDSLSVVDVQDANLIRQEISAPCPVLGIPNFDQAYRVLKLQLNRAIRGNRYVEFETSVRALGIRPGDLITVTYIKEGLVRQPFRVTRISPSLNYRTMMVEAQWHEDSWYSITAPASAGSQVSGDAVGARIGTPRPIVGSVLDENLEVQYSVRERFEDSEDETMAVVLDVGFSVPRSARFGALRAPSVSITPTIDTIGGSIPGNRILYYAVAGVTASGDESELSFPIKAVLPGVSSTNRVHITNLSFPNGTTAYNVYRGDSLHQLLRIASEVPLGNSFTDTGLPVVPIGPPDRNFDHAVFEWRFELLPEVSPSSCTASTIGAASLSLTVDEYVDRVVRITSGTGRGQEKVIVSNTPTTISIRGTWETIPDFSSKFTIVESTWQSGAKGKTSPVTFTVPNRPGATVQICGRAVSPLGRDSGYELAPITRWRLSGQGGSRDIDVPPEPIFALAPMGAGVVVLSGVGFNTLENTRTISSGTLTLHFWDELLAPTSLVTVSSLPHDARVLYVNEPEYLTPGMLVQIDREILEIEEVGEGIKVRRGEFGSAAEDHAASSAVYPLARRTFVLPFVKDFFGSPTSGSFSFPIYIPDVRIAAAEMLVTNSRGNSQSRRNNVTMNADSGIRTLSGGQLTLQYEGHLAIQANAVPPLVIESTHAVRDIFAVLREGPVGGTVELRLRQGDEDFCNLTIPDGATTSAVVSGFGKKPLSQLAQLNLDIVGVPQGWNMKPGRDLTVTIRL